MLDAEGIVPYTEPLANVVEKVVAKVGPDPIRIGGGKRPQE